MNKSTWAMWLVLAALAGCSSNSSLYHDQPLVAKVDTGMSKAQVLQIGGEPGAQSDRTVVPGTCFDYMLTKPGQKQQPYMVSFDQAGKVDRTSFMTCAEWSNAQQKSRQTLPGMGGMGGSGY
ncbi:osmotically-inducible lipoprotein OsmE [Pseudomonas sp. TWI628]|uniref:osmotically-inducible lipoprotein OsmE n=1 Tax=Pseudomonas sp. TWI628 TaxID=3136788 RepID=UPI003209A56F